MCSSPTSPIPTFLIYFDSDSLITWRFVLIVKLETPDVWTERQPTGALTLAVWFSFNLGKITFENQISDTKITLAVKHKLLMVVENDQLFAGDRTDFPIRRTARFGEMLLSSPRVSQGQCNLLLAWPM